MEDMPVTEDMLALMEQMASGPREDYGDDPAIRAVVRGYRTLLARCAALEAQVTLLARCAALEAQVRKDHARVQSKSKPDIVYCMACQAWEWPCAVLTTLGLAAPENGGDNAG